METGLETKVGTVVTTPDSSEEEVSLKSLENTTFGPSVYFEYLFYT